MALSAGLLPAMPARHGTHCIVTFAVHQFSSCLSGSTSGFRKMRALQRECKSETVLTSISGADVVVVFPWLDGMLYLCAFSELIFNYN